jgi:hypothetical protein
MSEELDAEDAKLVTLARGARERIRADFGAAVRDDTGRTYAAADALLPSIPLSAVQVVAAQAWISGARGLEAAVIIAPQPDRVVDTTALVDLGGGEVPVIVCTPDGAVARITTSGSLSGRDRTP